MFIYIPIRFYYHNFFSYLICFILKIKNFFMNIFQLKFFYHHNLFSEAQSILGISIK